MYIATMSCFILTYTLMPLGNLAASTRWKAGDRQNDRVGGAMTWAAIAGILTPERVTMLCFGYVGIRLPLNLAGNEISTLVLGSI